MAALAWRNSTWHTILAFLLRGPTAALQVLRNKFCYLVASIPTGIQQEMFLFLEMHLFKISVSGIRIDTSSINPDSEYSTCTLLVDTTTRKCKYLYVALSVKKWYWCPYNYFWKLNRYFWHWICNQKLHLFQCNEWENSFQSDCSVIPHSPKKQWATCPSQPGRSLRTVLFGDSLVLLALDGN